MASKKNAKKKTKMVLAKDPKQAAAAIAVMALFLGTTIYNVVSYNMSQNPPPAKTDDATMAQDQSYDMMHPNNPSEAEALPQDANDIYNETLKLKGENPAAPQQAAAPGMAPGGPQGRAVSAAHPEEDIEIMSPGKQKRPSGKRVLIAVAGSGRSNPFLPAGENYEATSSLPKFSVLPPPEQLAVGSDAGAVMGTTISGILYDKYSPSAIITIGGTDYLVKKGDVVNKYNVLSISKDSVVVRLGKNVYKAGVGQLLAQGQMNHNAVANLSKKFAGNEVSINVRKKGY